MENSLPCFSWPTSPKAMVRTEWNTVEEKDKTAAGIQVVQIQMAGETK